MSVIQRINSRVGSQLSYVCRSLSSAITYSKYGDPPEVLEMTSQDLPLDLGPEDVKIRILAAPINPADINMIQGTYAIKPRLPAVAGNEGVGEVIQAGSDVKDLSVGSWVIPSLAGWGTWRTHFVCSYKKLFEVDKRLGMESAATLAVNPCTAYRMLHDFHNLSPGDCIVQNGANSGVGRAVIQVAKNMGLVSVNVIRNREKLDELKQDLTNLGADHIILEEELRSPKMGELWSKVGVPKLGLNCVGGKSATELMRHLAPKSSLVTYGGMSKQPLTVPTGVLIFKDIRILGYWQSRWTQENEHSLERCKMYEDLTNMYLNGTLAPPNCKMVPFQNFKEAVIEASKPMVTHKQLLVMET